MRATILVLALGVPWVSHAQGGPLSLQAALAEARAHNAGLPVAAFDVSLGEAGVREAQGRLGPRLSVVGRLRVTPPAFHYDLSMSISEDRLQGVLIQPLYAGGELRAQVEAQSARARSARSAYRVAEADLELEVRSQFAALLAADAEISARQEGLQRLSNYLTLVRQRRASGEGLQADVLRTEARQYGEQSAVVGAARTRDEARLRLNELLGRDPLAPLELQPLPEPSPVDLPPNSPWLKVPDVAQADAEQHALQAEVEVAVARRRPHLDLGADIGFVGPGIFPVPGVSTPAERLRNDLGASIGVDLIWDFWDAGTYRAQLDQAHRAAEQAAQAAIAARVRAHLTFALAGVDLESDYRQFRIASDQVPVARDGYLLAESLYRGGSGTSLDVLDAFASWVNAKVAHADAILAWRTDEALLDRWGQP